MANIFSENKLDGVSLTTVVIGASGGLGSCVCRRALNRGWNVIGMSRGPFPLSESEIGLHGGNLCFLPVDLGDPVSVLHAAAQIKEKTHCLNGIVNCAGIVLGRNDGLDTLDMDDVRRSMEINVYGPMELIRQLLPLIRKGFPAGIVNVSSSAAAIPGTRGIDYPYSVSKCALNMFTEKLRVSLQDTHVHVAAIHPGWMKTTMGGPGAPVEPSEVADYILDIVCGEKTVTAEPAFVNRFGQPVQNRNEI